MTRSVSLFWLALVGCLSDDPAHCAHREGNRTCAVLGEAPYCSICASKNYGCVEKRPGDAYYRGGNSAPGEDAGTTDPATTEADTEGMAAPECADPQGGDPACPEIVDASDPDRP